MSSTRRRDPDVPSIRPRTGTIVSGRYRLLRELGLGATSAVWEALDTRLERRVALKFLHTDVAHDRIARRRFRREALSSARVTHEHVAGLYDVIDDGDGFYLVIELVDGPSLERIRARRPRLDDATTAAIGLQTALGLADAHHEGLVHLDVKPANLLLRTSGVLAIIDFGIARLLTGSNLTTDQLSISTVRYSSPEQVEGEPGDERSDVYSLGLTLWECAAGRTVYDGDTLAAVATARLVGSPQPLPDTDPRLAETIAIATSREPRDRFRSARGLADSLEAVCGPRPALLTQRLLASMQDHPFATDREPDGS